MTRGQLLVDEAQIREFLASSYPPLVTAIAVMSGSRPGAEDAVQEALARAWEASLRGEEIRELGAWVRTVAINLSRSGMRRRLAERRATDRVERGTGRLAGLAAEPSPDRVDVVAAIARLPRLQREATVLRYYLGLNVAEIAGALRVRQGTVKTSLHRARQTLAGQLGERDSEEATDHEPR